MRWSIAFVVSAALAGASVAAQERGSGGTSEASVDSLDALLRQLRRIEGMRARFEEEKHIELLRRPLRASGQIQFAAPGLLLREVRHPEPSTLLLDGSTLRIADASGVRTIELESHPVVRHFVLTFVHVLSGNRAELERLYALQFDVLDGGGWRLRLVPTGADLGGLVEAATVTGRGVKVDTMELLEPNGDSTRIRFSQVDPAVRYDAKRRAQVFRLPGK